MVDLNLDPIRRMKAEGVSGACGGVVSATGRFVGPAVREPVSCLSIVGVVAEPLSGSPRFAESAANNKDVAS